VRLYSCIPCHKDDTYIDVCPLVTSAPISFILPYKEETSYMKKNEKNNHWNYGKVDFISSSTARKLNGIEHHRHSDKNVCTAARNIINI